MQVLQSSQNPLAGFKIEKNQYREIVLTEKEANAAMNAMQRRLKRPFLLPAEQNEALRLARMAKAGILNEIAYHKKVFPSGPPVIMTAGMLMDDVIRRANRVLEQKGGTVKEYVIDQRNRSVIYLLCQYFTNDPQFEAAEPGYSLKKGIFLCGQMGCGKTMLMRLFQQNDNFSFHVKSTLAISQEYKDKESGGTAIINRYSQMHYDGEKRLGYCFDDIGDERATGNFGDKFNLFDILKARYDRLPYNATHATSNLDPGETDAEGNPTGYFAQDPRMRERMRESFNVIAFPFVADPHMASRRR